MEFYGACAHNRKWQIFYNLAMETLKNFEEWGRMGDDFTTK